MIQLHNETTPSRAAFALLVGAVIGAALVLLGMLGPMFLQAASWGGPVTSPLPYTLMLVMLVFGSAFAVFAAGLFGLAAPVWWLLHKLGLRRWFYAVILGVVLSFAVDVGITTFNIFWPTPGSSYSSSDSGGPEVVNNKLTPHGWHNVLRGAVLVSVAGGIVGIAVWGMAYRWDALGARKC